MKASAEESIRKKAFPTGITDEKWEEWKHTHSGTNWVGFAINAMEEHTKDELLAFKKWYDKLPAHEKVAPWNPKENETGFSDLSDEQIIEKWNRYQYPKNTKFESPDAVINVIVNG